MKHSPEIHHRHSARLRGYDYAQAGAYFVTLCTEGRPCLFGEVVGDEMRLSDWGRIVQEEWLRSKKLRPGIGVDAFVVMPNHLHGILILGDEAGGAGAGAHSCAPLQLSTGQTVGLHRPPRSLGAVIAGFKSAVTKRINAVLGTPGTPVWQRNYYEHVIRSERELDRTREYIVNNPAKWMLDRENPSLLPGAVPTHRSRFSQA